MPTGIYNIYIIYIIEGINKMNITECVPELEDCVIIRGNRSGVFAGYLSEEVNRTVVSTPCRRLWI